MQSQMRLELPINNFNNSNVILNRLIGLGLRYPHYKYILENKPAVGWFEVHSENFFCNGGASLKFISEVRQDYPLSLHGVGLSLGSAEDVDDDHLLRLKGLIELINPIMVSEHLSWSKVNGIHMNDLLPVPYNQSSLELFSRNLNKAQSFLKRELLIENPSSYVELSGSDMDEADFINELCQITGAKLLLDINNIYVSCFNHNIDPYTYIDKIKPELVREIHLSGHTTKEIEPETFIKVDTHNSVVCQEVWDLYGYCINKLGSIMTLLEWDSELPPFIELQMEANKINQYLVGK